MSRDDDLHPNDEPALISADDELSADEEAAIARLLAEAAGPVTMPTEVADRLDTVLAGLVAERGSSPTRSPDEPAGSPDALAGRRRRWPRMMLAAAAVVIGGYGVTTALGPGGLSGDSAGDASRTADEGAAAGVESEPEAATRGSDSPGPAGSRAPSGAMEKPEAPRLLALGPVRLRPDRLEEDVRRMLAGPAMTDGQVTARSRGCGPPALDADESWVLARYAGRRTVLVTDRGAGGAVDASVYSCAGKLIATVTVDTP